MVANLKRCQWLSLDKPDYIDYHDKEWGVPVHDDRQLFEMLILEGAQAGLSWYTILKRRETYRKVFKGFEPIKVMHMTDTELKEILVNTDVIRNRLKVFSVRKNASVFVAIQKEFGSFDSYIWKFTDGETKVNRPNNIEAIPTRTLLSDRISKDLKKRGMGFVGTTIIYAYMQAIGIVDDHTVDCFRGSR